MIKQVGNTLNKITAFFVGLLLGASYFLFFVKTFNLGGAVFAIASSFAFNFLIRKLNMNRNIYISWGNIGLLSCNIAIAVISIIVYSVFYVAVQQLIS